MFEQIKNNVEGTLAEYVSHLDMIYRLDRISPHINAAISDYVLRPGKRVRPVLFVAGYKAFSKKEPEGLYTSSLCIELLHDFMLIHDDIIDRSDTRRGKPAMHKLLEKRFSLAKGAKFTGQDLSIVIGDIIYAMAIHTFLTVKEEPIRKEKGLKRFIEAAMFTGSGEFLELIYGATSLDKLQKNDIYKIYDYKTACYTFACPLSIGAILGGAKDTDVQRLFNFGIYLGRAFQIKDDILGIFGDEKEIGKSVLTDLQESKKTLLIFYAYRDSGPKDRAAMKRILSKEAAIGRKELEEMRGLIRRSGALDKCSAEISGFIRQAGCLLDSSGMRPSMKKELGDYTRSLLQV